MELIQKLETELKQKWTAASKAKTQLEVQQKRAEALAVYRLLKKQRIQHGQA